jgi:adenylate kinase family enzyme
MQFTSKKGYTMKQYPLFIFILVSSASTSISHDFAPPHLQYHRIGRYSDEDSFDRDCVKSVIASAPLAIKKIIVNLLYPPKNKTALPKRLLLVGKPGTGKTTLAKAMAFAAGYDYYLIEAPFLLNEYKNSGPQNLLREIYPIFHRGEPVVIIIDEITELTDRHKKENDTDSGVAAALWVLLDSCAQFDNVFFIGTSNKQKKDLPIQLQSRFDEDIITIELPDAAARKRVFEHHLKKEQHKIDDKYLNYLVKKTNGRSVREIEKVVFKAVQFANARTPQRYTLNTKDFERALKLWKSLWHPMVIYERNEERIQSFCKNVLPTLLQLIGLMHGIYSAERQQQNAQEGLIMQRLALVMQEETLKGQQESFKAQKLAQAMQEESLKCQKASFESHKKQTGEDDRWYKALGKKTWNFVGKLGSIVVSAGAHVLAAKGAEMAWKYYTGISPASTSE